VKEKAVVIPRVDDVAEVEISKWYVHEGDRITPDALLAELLADKAAVELRSEDSGKVVRVLKAEGEVVKVGDTVLIIECDE
jgi:pyruvate/2-oxoglutarate dehydrogenase complex dihydrolipoamide acyltransferase (E2) component